MSEADEERRLRSGKVVVNLVPIIEKMEDDEQIEADVQELRGCVNELQQKLAMSEQAVNDKDEELRTVSEAMERAESKAATDLEQAREVAKQERSEPEHEHREVIKSIELQIQRLREHAKECAEELTNREVKFEISRLQGLETVKQNFDREREVYLLRIQTLEKELLAEKELHKGPTVTTMHASSESR